MSQYIPYDVDKKRFTVDFRENFRPVNISALSPTLVESELFGHRKGSFTGAVGDHVGWLESCPPTGSIFFDEQSFLLGLNKGTISPQKDLDLAWVMQYVRGEESADLHGVEVFEFLAVLALKEKP